MRVQLDIPYIPPVSDYNARRQPLAHQQQYYLLTRVYNVNLIPRDFSDTQPNLH